jgi:hypothetical protein
LQVFLLSLSPKSRTVDHPDTEEVQNPEFFFQYKGLTPLLNQYSSRIPNILMPWLIVSLYSHYVLIVEYGIGFQRHKFCEDVCPHCCLVT